MATRESILKTLDWLVGHWHSTGEMLSDDGSPAVEVRGTDTYEWLAGGQFMIHRVNVEIGGEHVEAIELIGEFDEQRDGCTMHAFQSDGSHGVMWAHSISDRDLLFENDEVRAHLTAAADGKSMTAQWERRDGAAWASWMTMRFDRAG